MKRVVIGMICAGMLLLVGSVSANAAPKSKSKKPEGKAAENMQCREMTLIGTVELLEVDKKDAEGKVVRKKEMYFLVDSKGKKYSFMIDMTEKVKEFVGVKVKYTGMVAGSVIASIKSLDKL